LWGEDHSSVVLVDRLEGHGLVGASKSNPHTYRKRLQNARMSKPAGWIIQPAGNLWSF
jgi:hypothetical protein